MTEFERIRYLEGVLIDMASAAAKGDCSKLHAIRAYRAATGATLKDSKDFVEALHHASKQSVEDSRIQRVEDRLIYLERRVGLIETGSAA